LLSSIFPLFLSNPPPPPFPLIRYRTIFPPWNSSQTPPPLCLS
jgi:hypothetical protein